MTDVVIVETVGGPVVEVTQQPVYTVTVVSTGTQTVEIAAVGPQGPSGSTGPAGPTGPTGPAGPPVDTTILSLDGGNF